MSSYSTVTTAALRNALSDILGRVRHTHDRVIVTRAGRPVAAIISIEELKEFQEMEDRADIEAADRVMEEGVFYDLDEVLAELGA